MDLSQGNITKQLIRFSFPIIISLICSTAFTVSDSVLVSICCGQDALATISSISPIITLAYILINGFVSAFTIIASKNIENKEKVFHHAITLCGMTGLILVLIFLFASPLFIKLMQVPSSIWENATYCLRIYGLSLLPSMIMNVYTSLFNGFNEAKLPSIISISSNILNIGLDLLFMACFHLPVVYAVYASLLSITFAGVIFIFTFNQKYHLHFCFNIEKDYTINILKLASSMMLQQSVMNICGMLISVKINTLGVECININAACENILNLFITALIGFAQAFTIYVGTNLEKKQYIRIKEGFKVSLKIGIVLITLMSVITYFTFPIILDFYLPDLSPLQSNYACYFKIILIITLIPYYIKYLIDGFPKAYEQLKYYMISSLLNLGSRMILLYILISSMQLYATLPALLISIILAAVYNLFIYFRKYQPLLY